MTWLNHHLPVRHHPAFRVTLLAALIGLALAAGIVLLFEAARTPAHPTHTIHQLPVDLEDGRTVLCVFFDDAGASCDWSEAR